MIDDADTACDKRGESLKFPIVKREESEKITFRKYSIRPPRERISKDPVFECFHFDTK